MALDTAEHVQAPGLPEVAGINHNTRRIQSEVVELRGDPLGTCLLLVFS